MGFTTKINLSENRLYKQTINTKSNFDGINEFSVPLEKRRLGGDYSNSIKTIVETDILTNFEYVIETDSLIINFINEEMKSSSENIPTITFEINNETYTVLPKLEGYDPYHILGVEFFNNYKGYEYDLTINDLEATENGFIGTFYTPELILVDAPSLDYKGDNIVFKVNGFSLSDMNLSKIKYNIIDIDGEFKIEYDNHYTNNLYVLNHSVSISETISVGSELNFIKNNHNIIFPLLTNIINNESISETITTFIKINKDTYIKK